MYKIVNKKGENKKCNNRVAWSVQQLRKREEIKWGIRLFEFAFQFIKILVIYLLEPVQVGHSN